MYSSESGIDTDHEGRSQELKLVAVIPNKAQYNAKENIVLIFNSNLSDKGSYHAQFKGLKRSKMDVKANKVNSCTLVVEAPIYHPVEKVQIHVRHRTYEGSKIIGSMPFKFLSREEILADILRDYTGDPVTFMCESLGISPSDISALDDALAITFKRNMPKGFNLLGLHNDSIGSEPCNSLHPTLLHFAAAFGLSRLTKDCLLQCPGVSEASKMKNCRGMKPNEIAANGGYDELADEILTFQGQQEEGIYESMEEKDAEYLQMAPGYINVQLWSQQSYIEMEREQSHEANEHGYLDISHSGVQENDDFYMEMNKQQSAEDKDHGYIDANRSDVQESDDFYMDMTKSSTDENSAGHYVDVKGHEDEEDLYENQYRQDEVDQEFAQDENEQFYEPMVGDTGLGGEQSEGANATYDTPSNLPVSRYPDARSASVSMGAGGRRKKKNLPKELQQEKGTPPVPRRLTGQEATSPRERLPSTGSRISNLSNTSTVSGASTSTTGSGHDGDAEDEHDEEELCMSREELIRQLENKQKKERPSVIPENPRSSYAGAALPPLPPPADYDQQQQLTSPPPVPSRGHCPRSPRAPRNHERSKTAPVNPSDVALAQKPNRNTSKSAKKPPDTRPSQGTRPHLTKHPSSDLTAYGRAHESVTDQRRNSSEAISRPPAPVPGDRPPAPVPKEPTPAVRDPRARLGGFPTPMVLAMERRVEEPPPAPRRGQSAGQADEPPPAPRRGPSAQQGGPPKLQPRPAPRRR